MKDIIKAMLLIAFSISLLIYDQQSYEAAKKEDLRETRENKKAFNPLVQDYQIKYTKPTYDSASAKLFNHKYFQATKSELKEVEY